MKTKIYLNPTRRQCESAKHLLRPRQRQWTFAPGDATAIVEDQDNVSRKVGRYWKTIKSAKHIIEVESYAVITPRRIVHYYLGLTGKSEKTVHAVPVGFGLQKAGYNLMLVRDSDGADYHPLPDEMRDAPATWVPKLEANAIRRAEIEARLASENSDFRAKYSANTMVTLDDSRRAGNCVEGSLQFAERKLKLSRDEVLSARHLFAVPAERLMRVANGDAARVKLAIVRAWERETTITI